MYEVRARILGKEAYTSALPSFVGFSLLPFEPLSLSSFSASFSVVSPPPPTPSAEAVVSDLDAAEAARPEEEAEADADEEMDFGEGATSCGGRAEGRAMGKRNDREGRKSWSSHAEVSRPNHKRKEQTCVHG